MSEKNWFRGDADMLAYVDEWHAKRTPPPPGPELVTAPKTATATVSRKSDDDSGVLLPLAIGALALIELSTLS